MHDSAFARRRSSVWVCGRAGATGDRNLDLSWDRSLTYGSVRLAPGQGWRTVANSRFDVRFCHWYPIATVEDAAPADASGPGMFQIRVQDGLVQYPSGQSAMIHYQVCEQTDQAVQAFAAAHRGRPWLCRHLVELTALDRAQIVAFGRDLEQQFVRRFGHAPRLPT